MSDKVKIIYYDQLSDQKSLQLVHEKGENTINLLIQEHNGIIVSNSSIIKLEKDAAIKLCKHLKREISKI